MLPSTILIVVDHEVVRQGLRMILGARKDWKICGEASDGEEAIAAAGATNPDVIIMDITMPNMNGLEATQKISKLNLRSRVLIFTMHDSHSLVLAIRQAGARGYVLKSHAARDLIHAVEAILAGGTFFRSEHGSESELSKSISGMKRA